MLINFLNESNGIEGILQPPTEYQLGGAKIFLALDLIQVADVSNIVNIFEPKTRLRNGFGWNVTVGDYAAPLGGPEIASELFQILANVNGNFFHPISNHKDFENLHPYTDCNGRSGRLLWLWQMQKYDFQIYGTFLKTFYYQALNQL